MNAPLLSNISLVTEILVTAAVLYTFYSGYRHNKFPTLIAAATLLYELIFNISYMANRAPTVTSKPSPATPLAIVHGILSLIMFILLVVFFCVAWSRYRKGENFFQNHKILTFAFLFFWFVSVLSGISFYILKYVVHI